MCLRDKNGNINCISEQVGEDSEPQKFYQQGSLHSAKGALTGSTMSTNAMQLEVQGCKAVASGSFMASQDAQDYARNMCAHIPLPSTSHLSAWCGASYAQKHLIFLLPAHLKKILADVPPPWMKTIAALESRKLRLPGPEPYPGRLPRRLDLQPQFKGLCQERCQR